MSSTFPFIGSLLELASGTRLAVHLAHPVVLPARMDKLFFVQRIPLPKLDVPAAAAMVDLAWARIYLGSSTDQPLAPTPQGDEVQRAVAGVRDWLLKGRAFVSLETTEDESNAADLRQSLIMAMADLLPFRAAWFKPARHKKDSSGHIVVATVPRNWPSEVRLPPSLGRWGEIPKVGAERPLLGWQSWEVAAGRVASWPSDELGSVDFAGSKALQRRATEQSRSMADDAVRGVLAPLFLSDEALAFLEKPDLKAVMSSSEPFKRFRAALREFIVPAREAEWLRVQGRRLAREFAAGVDAPPSAVPASPSVPRPAWPSSDAVQPLPLPGPEAEAASLDAGETLSWRAQARIAARRVEMVGGVKGQAMATALRSATRSRCVSENFRRRVASTALSLVRGLDELPPEVPVPEDMLANLEKATENLVQFVREAEAEHDRQAVDNADVIWKVMNDVLDFERKRSDRSA